MNTDQLQILAPDRRKHGEEICELLPKVFAAIGNGFYDGRRFCRESYVLPSHYDWAVSRIGMIGQEIVSHFGVWGYDMRIGSGVVRVGGIGAVATNGDYRKRGFMDHTARASMDAMREQGYDMTILFGINNFYHRFGYVRAWSDTTFIVEVNDLPTELPVPSPRKFTMRNRQDLNDLFNRQYATTTGMAVRPTYPKHNYFMSTPLEGYAWGPSASEIEGYVLLTRQGSKTICIEYCGDHQQALRVLGAYARRWHSEEVRFETLPYQSELAKALRRGNCRTEGLYRCCGAAMIALLNLRSTTEKIAGELSRRLLASPLASWQGDLLLDAGTEQVTLSIDNGQVRVMPAGETAHAIRGGNTLVQLLIGTDTPAEVIEGNNMTVTGDARFLAEVLFPAQYPQLSMLDHY